jgi:transcriptional regulator with XRE-family HTH domain
MKITGAQIRAARAFLDWTLADLAKASGVSDSTIRSIERNSGVPTITGGLDTTLQYRTSARDDSIEKLVRALEAAGIEFLPERGGSVGLRGQIKS